MKFQLNPDNDPSALASDYSRANRLHVPRIFTDATAKEIHRRLAELDWWLTFNEGGDVHQLHPTRLRQLRQEEAAHIQQGVYQRARTSYQFIYNYYPLLAAYFSPKIPPMPLFPVYEFINSQAFLDFARTLTGCEDIKWADAQATLFRPTQFLKYHTDAQSSEKRRAAYVLNFTETWDTDWGGLLQFWAENGDVEHAFRPSFNALNIFTVPQPHSVSCVTPYAPGLRFSITGWLRADEPPGPIPAS
ncbi:2OG-Fe(II) oxygenase [Qipengyuania seohaensis]|uniref:2OG-Fe(II) oxygenase n=1 Tax=Qipengyuania seohaensis TaxID=266951 RepID=UPI0012FDDB61|nr:2OG-Fe(II) oxygenase family protein [Qipengyuania seohaensis]